MIDLTDTSTKLGAEREVVWQEHKQTVENCCKLCDNEAKSELIEMLSESMERDASSQPEAASSSDDETIIPDNTQAQILLPNLL